MKLTGPYLSLYWFIIGLLSILSLGASAMEGVMFD